MNKTNFKEKSISLLKNLFEKFKSLPRRKQILYVAIAVLVLVVVPSPSVDDEPSKNNTLEVNKDQEVKEDKKEEEKEEPKPIADKEEQEEETPFEDLSFEEQVNKIITEQGQENVIEINTDYGEINTILKMEDNFTNNLIVSSMKRKAFEIFEGLQSIVEHNNVNNITVTYQTTFIDKYGNESLGNACIISIDTAELIKVNFKNVFPEDLDNFCTVYIHPSLKK